MQSGIISPYGGRLIQRFADEEQKRYYLSNRAACEKLVLDSQSAADLQLIATGAYSPLTGFMRRDHYSKVLTDMHLSTGLPWTMPITLPAEESWAKQRRAGEWILLTDAAGIPSGLLKIEETYPYDVRYEAKCVFKTEDERHPGVARLYRRAAGRTWYVAGPVLLLQRKKSQFPEVEYDPVQTRQKFSEKKWRKVVAFQTRNPIHRAHEYIQKCALELMDGLFLHPLVGETKEDDVPARVRMESYKVLLKRYYPQDRVVLGVFPASMRYAGPREAVFHAIVRRNYGCSHIIIGRDHAGVGNYYGTYEAQELFDQFDAGLLGIEPLRFEHAFYCRSCVGMVTTRTCPHDPTEHVVLSGTKVRQMLRRGELPPPEYSRPEVAKILADHMLRRETSEVSNKA